MLRSYLLLSNVLGVCEPVNSDKCKTVNNKWLGQCGGEGADSSEECDGTTSLTAPLALIIPSLSIIVIKKFFMWNKIAFRLKMFIFAFFDVIDDELAIV